MMTRIPFWMTLVLFPVVLYAACQGSGSNDILVQEPDADPVVTQEAKPVEQEGASLTRGEAPAQDKPAVTQKKPEETLKKVPEEDESEEADVVFEDYAFPPTVSDVDYHKKAWYRDDCLRCHETGVGDATQVKHEGMAAILLKAKCRSCHVLIPGMAAIEPRPKKEDDDFESYAFPPMIPASASHADAWIKDNCLMCHESGVRGAPEVKHEGMPKILLKSKCRSCHVQVRSANIPGR